MKKVIREMSKYIAIVSVVLSCSQMPSAVLDLNPTTSPAGVSATAKSSSSIDVQWTRVSGATSYGIFRRLSSGGSFAQVGSASDTSFLDTGLIANMEYYYKIMANDSVHQIESKFSADVSAITMTVQPPALISPANAIIGQPLIRSLSWAAVTGSVSYHVQVSRDSTFTTIFAEDSTLVSDSITVTGFANSASYYWRVRTKDPGGVSVWSSSWNFTTIIAAPSVPVLVSPLDSAANQPVSLLLFWNKAARASTYFLQVAIDTGFVNVAKADPTLTDTSKAISGLANNTAYYWRVQAQNAGGTSGWSSVRGFVTIVAAPQAPTLTTPVNGATDLSVTPILTWATVIRAATYHVQVSTANTFATILVEDSTLTSASKALSGLANATQYYWRVQAKNAGGVSSWTSPWSFTTIIAAPATPTLTSPADGTTGLSLTPTLVWSMVTGAATYRVQVSTVNTFANVVIEDSTLTSASKALSGLANGTQYYWRVQAKNAGGVSSWTSPWSFTTIIAAPATPTLTSPADGTTGLSLTPTLTWSTVTGAATYHVQASTVNTFATILVEDSTLTSATKALNGLANGTQYYWRVQAKNAGGVSAWTNPWGFMTIIAEPQTPTLTAPTDGTTGLSLTPILTWSTVDGTATYHVQVSTSNTFTTVVIEDSTLTSASKALSGFTNGTQYYWRVRAKNAGGVSAWTSPWTFTTITAAPQMPTLTSPANGATGQSVTPTLTWSGVAGAATYHVQMSTNNTFTTILIEDSTLTVATKALSGLANGMQYYWRVQAKNAGGLCTWTSPWSFTTIIAAPQAPTLTAPVNGATEQTLTPALTWSMVSDAAVYHVQVSTVSTFASVLAEDSSLTSASKTLGGLTKSTTYYWRVQAKNAGGSSIWSSVFSFTTSSLIWTSENTGIIFPSITALAVSGSNVFAATGAYSGGGSVFLSKDNGTTWNEKKTGLPASGTVNTFAVIGTNVFAGMNGGGVFISTDSGTTWTAKNTGLTNVVGSWIAIDAFAVKGTSIFAGGQFTDVFLSTDSGATWTAKSTGLNPYAGAQAFAVSGTNILAGQWGAGIWSSTDNGNTWTAKYTGLWSDTTLVWVRAFGVSGTNIFAGTNSSGVFLSTDNGSTWTTKNTGLTNHGVGAFAESGTNVFVGTNGGGVFLSTDNGNNWIAKNAGLDSLAVSAFAISGTNIFVGTRGGVFRADLP